MSSRLDTALHTPESKRRYVARLFDTIAERYDLITVLLSYGQDRRWKRTLIARAGALAGRRVLDLATGTGDLAWMAAREGAEVTGVDLVPRMLALARAKAHVVRRAPRFLTADMMALPFPDGAFDVVTTGYGLRNVPVLEPACAEIARVLRPGGRLLSLDFSNPESTLVRGVYLAYLGVTGSAVGWLLHGDPDTYRYIPASLRRYPSAQGVAGRLSAQGFADVEIVPLLAGLMTLHVATRQ
jgi:ubiquinone/menaquinone biosynthesis methyltransferase